MALTNEVALHLLGGATQIDRRRLETALTAVRLATTDHDVVIAWCTGRQEGRFQLDSELVANLYASAPRRIKLALITDGPLGHLEPKRFRSVFLDAIHLRGLSDRQRQGVIWMLEAFLRLHPARVHDYEPYILGFLRSRRRTERLSGLPMMGWLDWISRGDLEIMRSCLSAEFDFQMHALNAFCELLKRYRSVAPEVLAFCSSDEVAAAARRIYRRPADRPVRLCAYYYLKALKRFRGSGCRARRPARARRRNGRPPRR